MSEIIRKGQQNVSTHHLRVEVKENHRISLVLPTDFPLGPADIVITAEPASKRENLIKLSGCLDRNLNQADDPVATCREEMRSEREAKLQDGSSWS